MSAEVLFAEYPEVLPIVKGHVWPIDINLFVAWAILSRKSVLSVKINEKRGEKA